MMVRGSSRCKLLNHKDKPLFIRRFTQIFAD